MGKSKRYGAERPPRPDTGNRDFPAFDAVPDKIVDRLVEPVRGISPASIIADAIRSRQVPVEGESSTDALQGDGDNNQLPKPSSNLPPLLKEAIPADALSSVPQTVSGKNVDIKENSLDKQLRRCKSKEVEYELWYEKQRNDLEKLFEQTVNDLPQGMVLSDINPSLDERINNILHLFEASFNELRSDLNRLVSGGAVDKLTYANRRLVLIRDFSENFYKQSQLAATLLEEAGEVIRGHVIYRKSEITPEALTLTKPDTSIVEKVVVASESATVTTSAEANSLSAEVRENYSKIIEGISPETLNSIPSHNALKQELANLSVKIDGLRAAEKEGFASDDRIKNMLLNRRRLQCEEILANVKALLQQLETDLPGPDLRKKMAAIKNSEELEGLNHYDISDLVPGKILEMTTASGNVYRLSIRTDNDGTVHTYLYNERQGTEVRADRLPAQVTLGKSFFATQLNDDGTITRTDSSVLAKIQIVDEVATPPVVTPEATESPKVTSGQEAKTKLTEVRDSYLEIAAGKSPETLKAMSSYSALTNELRRLVAIVDGIQAAEKEGFAPNVNIEKMLLEQRRYKCEEQLTKVQELLGQLKTELSAQDSRKVISGASASEGIGASLVKDASIPQSPEEQEKERLRLEQFKQKREAKDAFKVAEEAFYAEARKHAEKQVKLGVWANYWGKEAKPSAEYLAAEQALNVATNNRRQLTYERTDAMTGVNDTALVWSRERIDRGMASVMFLKRRENLQKIKEEALARYRESDTLVNSALRHKDAFMSKLSKAIRNENGEINNNKIVGLVGLGATAVGLAVTTVPVWATGTLIGAGTGLMVRSGAKALGNKLYVNAKDREIKIKETETETKAKIRTVDIAEQIKALTAQHKELDARKRNNKIFANVVGGAFGAGTFELRTGLGEQLYNSAVDAFSPTTPDEFPSRPPAVLRSTQAAREAYLRDPAEQLAGQPTSPAPEAVLTPPPAAAPPLEPKPPEPPPPPSPSPRPDPAAERLSPPIQATIRSGDKLWTMLDGIYREAVPQTGVSADRFRALPNATKDRLLSEVFAEMRANSSLREAIGIGANGDERRLLPGQRVDLRPLSQLMEQKINALTAAPSPLPEGVVVVQPNNTLWGIARSRFSDEFSGVSEARRNQVLGRLREAINTNSELRNAIGITSGNADRIYQGQQLNLTRAREFIRQELGLTQASTPNAEASVPARREVQSELTDVVMAKEPESTQVIGDTKTMPIGLAKGTETVSVESLAKESTTRVKRGAMEIIKDVADGAGNIPIINASAIAMGTGAAAAVATPNVARESARAPRQTLPAIEPGSVETTEFIEAAARQFGGSRGFTEAVANYVESVEPQSFWQAIFGSAENTTYGKINQMTIGTLAETSLFLRPKMEEFLLNNGISSNSFQIWAREIADIEKAIEDTGQEVPPELTVAELMSHYALIRPDLFKKA